MKTIVSNFSETNLKVAFGSFLISKLEAEGKLRAVVRPGDRYAIECDPFDVLAQEITPFRVRVELGEEIYEDVFARTRVEQAVIASVISEQGVTNALPPFASAISAAEEPGNVRVAVQYHEGPRVELN